MSTDNLKSAVQKLLSLQDINDSKKQGIVAQWLLQSGRGESFLAKSHNNFAELKMRPELAAIGAVGKSIKVPSEPAPVEFAFFATPEMFVAGYFAFIDRSIYAGWRKTKTGNELMAFLHSRGYATDPDYLGKVASLASEAGELIASLNVPVATQKITWWELHKTLFNPVIVGYNGSTPVGMISTNEVSELIAALKDYEDTAGTFAVAPAGKPVPNVPTLKSPANDEPPPQKKPGTNEPASKPAVIRKPTPNQSSRNGIPIKTIVMHYTTTRSDDSTISWFANPAARVSAHYLISRDGTIYQFVSDGNKAWHAANANSDTIGIEHSAAPGDKLTAAQEKASIALCRWLMSEYKIPKSRVTAHRFMGQATSCPGQLWSTEAELRTWVERHL